MQFMDLNEKRIHGTSDFPFAYYHITHTHPRYVMNYHWHAEYELIRVLEGELEMTLDENQYTVKSGDLVFVQGGILHSGTPHNCVYECLVFDLHAFARHNSACAAYIQRILDQSANIYPVFRGHTDTPETAVSGTADTETAAAKTAISGTTAAVPVDTDNYEDIHLMLQNVFSAMTSEAPGYEMMVFGELYHFFAAVFSRHLYTEAAPRSRKGQKKVMQLRQVLDYIDTNYSKPITLEELARTASMSPKYFCRFFYSMTHRTPIDYLNYQRIEHACYELNVSDASVTDIAYACGFNDLSYFIKTFRKYKGVTPGRYADSYC
ncbi:MAG: AraC family transcriptional regulator [Eubacteriales bacterium]|nr:AraC family transcriptional regulator [Eubacteriales bacterium]